MIFFLIGAPLGAIIRKGGLGMPVVVSVLFFVVYYNKLQTKKQCGICGAAGDSNLFNMDWYRIQYAKLKEWVGRKRQHRKESKKHGTKEALYRRGGPRGFPPG